MMRADTNDSSIAQGHDRLSFDLRNVERTLFIKCGLHSCVTHTLAYAGSDALGVTEEFLCDAAQSLVLGRLRFPRWRAVRLGERSMVRRRREVQLS